MQTARGVGWGGGIKKNSQKRRVSKGERERKENK